MDWWRSLSDSDECPITLEPLSSLPYPPFKLDMNYFDGLALASYVISRAKFQNPLTRKPLTFEDCHALDEYLEQHVYNINCDNERDYVPRNRKFSVLEAFTLWNSVNVKLTTTSALTGDDDVGDNTQRRRVDALRSEATFALHKLFVFKRGKNPRFTDNNMQTITSKASPQQRVPSIGFNLNKKSPLISTPATTNTSFEMEPEFAESDLEAAIQRMDGLTIIDKDLHTGRNADYDAWSELQNSFPPLQDGSGHKELTCDANGTEFPCAGKTGETYVSPMLEKIHETAQRVLVEEEANRNRAEKYRRLQLTQAKLRREEREQKRQETWTRIQQERVEEEKKKTEIDTAREEISRWREEQWNQIVMMNETNCEKIPGAIKYSLGRKYGGRQENFSSSCEVEDEVVKKVPATDQSDLRITSRTEAENDEGETNETFEEAKRLKAEKIAAKRKRAKERKKMKKAAEKERIASEIAKEELLRKKKESSSLKCAYCGNGILKLKCSFEKSGKLFCTTACARAGCPVT